MPGGGGREETDKPGSPEAKGSAAAAGGPSPTGCATLVVTDTGRCAGTLAVSWTPRLGPARAAHLVVGVELLVLALALPQGLPLGLQRLGQVGVLQALLRVLLRQHLQLPLHRLQLLPGERPVLSPRPPSSTRDDETQLRNSSKRGAAPTGATGLRQLWPMAGGAGLTRPWTEPLTRSDLAHTCPSTRCFGERSDSYDFPALIVGPHGCLGQGTEDEGPPAGGALPPARPGPCTWETLEQLVPPRPSQRPSQWGGSTKGKAPPSPLASAEGIGTRVS